MTCLYCGKPIKDTASETERSTCWHKSCVKKFFDTDSLPYIDVSEDTLKELAQISINKGYTVPGVQKKLSLHLTKDDNPRLTLVNYPTGYILKPQTEEYPAMPEAEHLIMSMAKETGIATVPFALMKSEKNGTYSYITKRIDRIYPKKKDGEVKMLAMEDFCQLDGRLTSDKYIGSYERCGKIVLKYSSRPGIDLSELFLRVRFSYAVGNSDMHLKNFSLIESQKVSGEYVLSEAYDLLPVNVILPTDPDHMALTLNGKKKNLRKNDFMTFAETIKLDKIVAQRMLKKVISMEDKYIEMCNQSFLPPNMKETLIQLIKNRISMLK